jgi:hypothetical protein
MTRSIKLLLATSICLALFAAPVGAATVVNGSFESGLTGWTTDAETPVGGWVTYNAGDALGSGITPPTPLNGSAASVTDMTGESSLAMYQDVALEVGYKHNLSLYRSYYNNAASWFFPSPASFSVSADPNQQYSIDVLKAGADPRTANPADVLAKVDAPTPASPLSTSNWEQKTADLSAFAGQTVRLRFVVVDTTNYLHLAVDDVAIASQDNTPPVVTSPSFSGGKFKFTSDSVGFATIGLEKSVAGKRSGKRCVKPTSRNRSKRNCKRWVKVGKPQTSGVFIGANSIAVKTSSLKPGRYRVTMIATDGSGLKSTPVSKTFTIRKKKRR